MQYREGDYSKLELAKIICGALHYVAINQGDSFSWTSGTTQWHKSSGHKKWQASIRSLYELDSEQGSAAQDSSIRGNLLWISDLYTSVGEMERIISLNAHHNIAVTLVHIMGRAEEELSFDSSMNFKDLETGERVELNPKAFRQTYQERLTQHYQAISDLCNSYNTPSIKIYLTDSIDRSMGHIVNHNNAHYR